MTIQQFLSILSSQKEELETNELTSFVSRYEEPLINLDSRMAQVVIGVRRSGKNVLFPSRQMSLTPYSRHCTG